MDRQTRIFVAGHGGLAGSAIVRQLRGEGYTELLLRSRAELDLLDAAATRAFFETERPDVVFIAAARVGGILANSTFPAEFVRENLAIQTNVIHEAWRCGVRRLLFLGSSCIYPRDCPQPICEEYLLSGPLEPTNRPYAVAKIAGIEMCWSYNRQYGTRFVCAMPTNLYGPGDNYDLQQSHVLPALLRKFHLAALAMRGDRQAIALDEAVYGPIPTDVHAQLDAGGREVVLWGTGAARREFLYSDDMAEACVRLMRLNDAQLDRLIGVDKRGVNAAPPVVNIGCGEDLPIRELADIVRNVVGYGGGVRWDAGKPDGTPRKLLDVSRLRGIGWVARTELRSGIARAFDDYLAGK